MSLGLTAHGGQRIAVAGRRLACPESKCEFELRLGRGYFYPGLINAHDHLHRNHYPRLGDPPYSNVYEWGNDLHGRFAKSMSAARAVDRRDALLFGALKNLIAGVTTVVHHDPWEPAFDVRFPINVVRMDTIHSLRLAHDLGAIREELRVSRLPAAIHLAEGWDTSVNRETAEAHALGLLGPKMMAVHVVGVDDAGLKLLLESDTAVVWCPSSNMFLYERTATRDLLNSGVAVLLGTDALVSGRGTLLEEMRYARELDLIQEDRLLNSVGQTAATRLGLEQPSLSPGRMANLIFLRTPIETATPRDVGLVLVDGRPVVADIEYGALFEHCDVPTELLNLGQFQKLVVSPLARVAREIVNREPSCARIFNEGF